MSTQLPSVALQPSEYEEWLQCHACLAQFVVAVHPGARCSVQCPECGEEVPMSHATSPFTAAHSDLIRLLAKQAARQLLLGQQDLVRELQKQEGAGEGLHPSPAPSTPNL